MDFVISMSPYWQDSGPLVGQALGGGGGADTRCRRP